jgi:hypothetical protein
MIPKTIHYCWFGHNPLPQLAQKCIESWKKYCPDYKIVEWNEETVDISACPTYVQVAYAQRKWAYVTDYIRLKVVYEHGGIYLDTDVELLKPLDNLLSHHAFMGCEGMENVNTGLGFGAEKGFEFLRRNMAVYEDMNPTDENGNFVSNPCPYYTTSLLKDGGVQFPIKHPTETADGMTLYPNHVFNPYDWKADKLHITKETVSIHHYSGSWMTEQQRKGYMQKAKSEQIALKFGTIAAKAYEVYFWSKKKNGGPGFLQWCVNKEKRH